MTDTGVTFGEPVPVVLQPVGRLVGALLVGTESGEKPPASKVMTKARTGPEHQCGG